MTIDSPGRRFREALTKPPLAIPGVFNALTARLAERVGFRAVYQSGAALSAGLGLPDVGLVTQTEFARASGLSSLRRVNSGHFRCRHRIRRGFGR